MRQPDNLPAFCRVHRNGRPLIGRSGRSQSLRAQIVVLCRGYHRFCRAPHAAQAVTLRPVRSIAHVM